LILTNIGVEVLRLALEGAKLKQRRIEELICSLDTDGGLLNLAHWQTILIKEIDELFNRLY
jgi:hypothetical protein